MGGASTVTAQLKSSLLRSLLEGFDEAQILAIDRSGEHRQLQRH
jgi:hypothetical protein